MKKWILILVFLLPGMILASGCTSPLSSPASPVTALPTSTPGDIPAVSSPAVTVSPGITFRPDAGQPSYGVVTTQTTRVQADNPHLEYLEVRKKTFDYSIPNCPFQAAFPAIAGDSKYGIQQTMPKLTALTKDQYDEFLAKYTEGKAENTAIKTLPACMGAEANPGWNFVEIRVILNPTNVRPASYAITQNVLSGGKTIAQFTTTRTLVIDEKVTLTSYVPVKADELDLFDTIGMTYSRP